MTAGSPGTILFVCRHGAAKSILAAADLRRLAADRGLLVATDAAGVDPSESVSVETVNALAEQGIDARAWKPRRVTAKALASAERVITFNLEPRELPGLVETERWDDIPAVGDDAVGARAAIQRHLEKLLEGLPEAL